MSFVENTEKVVEKKKKLTAKQIKALELLTCGEGRSYTSIAEEVGINRKTLYSWLNDPHFTSFQEELQRLNDERWKAIVDAAKASAMRLVQNDKADFVKFVLQNDGYNPTQKVEADIKTDIVINIDDNGTDPTESK